MGAGAEGPAALARVPVEAGRLRRAFQNLLSLDEAVRAGQRGPHALRLPGGDDGLDGEGCVPQLRGVVAVHLQPVRRFPEVVGEPGQVRALLLAARALEVPDQGVVELVHRPDADVVGGLVLGPDLGQHLGQRPLAQPARVAALEGAEDAVHPGQQRRARGVGVGRCDAVTRRGPVDGRVGLAVQLLAQLGEERCVRHPRPPPVEMAHRQVDHPAVAPQPAGMDGEPAREKPELGLDGVQAVVLVEPEHGEHELSPRRRAEGATVGEEPRPRPLERRVLARDAEQAERHVVQHRAEDLARALHVQSPAAVGVLVTAQVAEEAGPGALVGRPAEGMERGDVERREEERAAVVALPGSPVRLGLRQDGQPSIDGRIRRWVGQRAHGPGSRPMPPRGEGRRRRS